MNLGLGGHSAARGQADEEVFGSAYDQRVILRLGPFIAPYKKMAIISNGKVAKTFYRILEAFEDCALLEIDLITGRTHQVRVHLASIGHPVVSDDLYGSNMDILGRQFLHASMLEFKLPRNGDLVKLNCDLPSDLNLFLDKIKLNGKIEGMII